MKAYPWFKDKKWQREIQALLDNGFKMEVDALLTKSISFITEEYIPKKLRDKDFLDPTGRPLPREAAVIAFVGSAFLLSLLLATVATLLRDPSGGVTRNGAWRGGPGVSRTAASGSASPAMTPGCNPNPANFDIPQRLDDDDNGKVDDVEQCDTNLPILGDAAMFASAIDICQTITRAEDPRLASPGSSTRALTRHRVTGGRRPVRDILATSAAWFRAGGRLAFGVLRPDGSRLFRVNSETTTTDRAVQKGLRGPLATRTTTPHRGFRRPPLAVRSTRPCTTTST